MNNKLTRNLALFATLFALVVVVLGAFTRLSDAGLGCPDWPGCYGFMHISSQAEHIQAATNAFPETPYEFDKAWPEMVHRYFAGLLGVLVFLLALASWFSGTKKSIKHSTFLLLLIIFQAALGMWTVTMKLHPLIVMLHLMGGMATFALLASLTTRYQYQFISPFKPFQASMIKNIVFVSLVVVVIQVALGGWTSANYAATVCYELPICQGNWLNEGKFLSGFTLWGREAVSYEYGVLDEHSRIAIHAVHRLGAIVTTLVIGFLIFNLLKSELKLIKHFALVLALLLVVQVFLGVNNIIFQLPLANAVSHNAVGALLIVILAVLLTLVTMPKKYAEEVTVQ